MIGHEYRIGVTTEYLDDVNLGVVAEARIGRQHPKRSKESWRAGKLHARFDVAIRKREQVWRAIVRSWSCGRHEPGLVRALTLVAGTVGIRRRERFGHELRGAVIDL